MFLYGGLMGVIMIIFGVMSYFYKYVTPAEIAESEGVLASGEVNGEIPLEDKSKDDDDNSDDHENTKI